MDDRAERRLRAGHAPSAPGFVGWAASAGGLVAAMCVVPSLDWTGLAGCWSGQCEPRVAGSIIGTLFAASAGGALLGGWLARLTLGPIRPALRMRWHPRPRPKSAGVLAFGCACVGALAVPFLAPSASHGDPGWALVAVLGVALFAVGLSTGGAALIERIRARSAWRAFAEPWPPPKTDENEHSPAIRSALRRRDETLTSTLSSARLVIIRGDYAVAISAVEGRVPRVLVHGGRPLVEAARRLSVKVVDAPDLADQLVSTATGEPAPRASWDAIRLLLSALDP